MYSFLYTNGFSAVYILLQAYALQTSCIFGDAQKIVQQAWLSMNQFPEQALHTCDVMGLQNPPIMGQWHFDGFCAVAAS